MSCPLAASCDGLSKGDLIERPALTAPQQSLPNAHGNPYKFRIRGLTRANYFSSKSAGSLAHHEFAIYVGKPADFGVGMDACEDPHELFPPVISYVRIPAWPHTDARADFVQPQTSSGENRLWLPPTKNWQSILQSDNFLARAREDYGAKSREVLLIGMCEFPIGARWATFREDQLSGVTQPNSIQLVRLPMLGDSTVSGSTAFRAL